MKAPCPSIYQFNQKRFNEMNEEEQQPKKEHGRHIGREEDDEIDMEEDQGITQANTKEQVDLALVNT